MNNPMNMLKIMMNSKTPQQLIMNMMGQNSNPMISNLMEMANSGNNKGIEQFARNLCKQKGINYDMAFPEFMKQLKG